MSERKDERDERVKERDGEGKGKKSGHVQDGGGWKRSGSVWCLPLSHSGHQA